MQIIIQHPDDISVHLPAIFELAKECKLQPDMLVKSKIRAVICHMLIEIYEQVLKPEVAAEHYIITAAKKYLEGNYHRNISMDDLTRHLGYSSTWILKLFCREAGVPPAQYLQRYRIEKAKEMCRKGQMNITDIAFACGFHSSQYFSQVFKKYTGKSPSKFSV